MKRTFIYAFIAALSLGLFACSSTDEPSAPQGSSEFSDYKVSEDTENIAQLLASIPLSKEIVNEVFHATQDGIENGLEESYYFADVLSDSSSAKSVSRASWESKESFLGRELRSALNKSRSDSRVDADILLYGDYQIYWPYSENWDRKTRPIITFVPKDDNQLWNYGYKQTDNGFDTIIVDEKYMESNPVWIVNKADFSYDELPNFNNNEFIKNGISYCPRKMDYEESQNHTMTRAAGNPVYTVYLGKLKSEKQYDSVWSGGSEFAIRLGAIENMEITSEDQVKSENARINYVRVCRSRNDIKKKLWAELTGCVLSSDWQPNENNAAFSIYEEDQGSSKNYEANLSVNILGKNIGFSIKMPYGSHDDKICTQIYTRNFMFSTNNSSGTVFSSGGVYWTMPYEVGYTVL